MVVVRSDGVRSWQEKAHFLPKDCREAGKKRGPSDRDLSLHGPSPACHKSDLLFRENDFTLLEGPRRIQAAPCTRDTAGFAQHAPLRTLLHLHLFHRNLSVWPLSAEEGKIGEEGDGARPWAGQYYY
jgi:hypothetical protein